MADHHILEVQAIHTFIEQFHILEGVDFNVPAESITVLLGRNGAGKTTTLRSIIGLAPPRRGSVIFGGQAINGMRAFEIARLGIGYVPEHRAIFTDLTVAENLKIAERQPGDLDRKTDLIFGIFPDLYFVKLLHFYKVRSKAIIQIMIIVCYFIGNIYYLSLQGRKGIFLKLIRCFRLIISSCMFKDPLPYLPT